VADVLSRWRIPRGINVIVFYAGLGGTLALRGDLLVPVFKAELAHLQANQWAGLVSSGSNPGRHLSSGEAVATFSKPIGTEFSSAARHPVEYFGECSYGC
jgi:hypothetical protein